VSRQPDFEMPHEKFGREWNLEYVRAQLSGLADSIELPESPPPDAYEQAAAVLAYFDPNVIHPLPSEKTSGKSQLLLNSAVVNDEQGRPVSTLRSERRREALLKLGLQGIQGALSVNQGPDSAVQRMFRDYTTGTPKAIEQQELPELTATLQVSEWLAGLSSSLPSIPELQRRIERESLLRPCRELAGHGFSGRTKELTKLREYVAYLRSESVLDSAARGLRNILDWHEKPPLVIHGPGGMGKSALLSRFILDHLEAGPSNPEPVPFVYLDFDRASLVPERPATLLLEAGRQLAAQFPKMQNEWPKFRELAADSISRAPRVVPYSEFQEMLGSGSLLDLPLLFVLDTFEEVQYRSRDFVEEVFAFLGLLQATVPRLRVVVAGRARVSLDHYPTENYQLQPLDVRDAARFLEQRGVDPEMAGRVADQVGGNPLSLRLALEVIGKEGTGNKGIRSLETRNRLYMRLEDNQIQGQLYRRILGYVHSKEVEKLAHPGLVLRRITPELILKVLREPCGIDVPDIDAARKLFEEMQREVSLVRVEEDGSLRHLTEVRRVMVELLRKDDPAKVKEIQERVIDYYRSEPGMPSKIEMLYHMLALGRPRLELDAAWSPGMESGLGGVLEEIPPKSRAWLAPRLGLDVDDVALGQSDLEDWELYSFQRVVNMLQLGRADSAIELLRERDERSYGSPLLLVQAQAQWLTRDLEGALATIATGHRQLQDPVSLLKLRVITSYIDLLTGEGPANRDSLEEIRQVRKRYGDDPRALRFGVNRMHFVEDQWIAREGEALLADLAGSIADLRLANYPLLGSDVAIRLGPNREMDLIRLARIGSLGADNGPAARGLIAAVSDWDKQANIYARYHMSPEMPSIIPNLPLIQDREGLPPQVTSALVACFRERADARTDQMLYEEMERDSRPSTTGVKGPIALPQVLREEYQALRPESDFASRDQTELYASIHKHPQPLSALCISGGGIRSATFALGAIQGLAEHGLLDQFDYLSTVSGGGHIGSWLTSWSKRAGGLRNVIPRLRHDARPPGPGEPDPIGHLREYNNYLAPRLRALSADTWTLAVTVLRNIFLNWLVLVPLLMAALLAPRLLLSVARLGDTYREMTGSADAVATSPVVTIFVPLVSGLLLAIAIFNTVRYLPSVGGLDHTQGDFLKWVLGPLIGAILSFSAFDSLYFWGDKNIPTTPLQLIIWTLTPSAAGWLAYLGTCRRPFRQRMRWLFGPISLAVLLMSVCAGLSIWAVTNDILPLTTWAQYVTIAPPLLVVAFDLGGAMYVGLSSRILLDDDREWMARASAWTLLFSAAWLGGCVLVLLAPQWAFHWQIWGQSLMGAAGGLSGWLASRGASAEKGSRNYLLKLAPAAFVVTFIVGLTVLTNLIFSAAGVVWDNERGKQSPVMWWDHDGLLNHTNWAAIAAGGVLLLLLSWVMARYININRFSLHDMYRSRLIRAYLGASNPQRNASKFTGLSDADNIRMGDLRGTRPFHVVNIALNLVSGERLAWQQRKAQSFTVSPLHCGNSQLGYRDAAQYGAASGITLGTAVTISGAAASPNMGYPSSPIIGLIMTLFNARLGAWLGNPGAAGERTWRQAGPRFAVGSVVKEAFGLTNNTSAFVYLSDGGHFENLALYEMVLRRCRHIVLLDGSADPNFHYEDLANAMRKIRIELNVAIEFPSDHIEHLRSKTRRCAVATIRYSEVDAGGQDGVLVYVKPLMQGNEPPDVRSYSAQNPSFPHQSMASQWFNESQTESYRMLGLHTINDIAARWSGGGLDSFARHASEVYIRGTPPSPPPDGLPAVQAVSA
jgi:Patatin-like phospholipase